MKLFPVITAILVIFVLFAFVFQRDRLFEFAGRGDAVVESEATAVAVKAQAVSSDETKPQIRRVSVVAIQSVARTVENAVVLRGRTEALRQVSVMAETAGRVISNPLRKGAQVEANQILCELDPGTKAANLAEAQARLTEARTRIPESKARVAEAMARLDEASINQNAAARLSQGGFASTTRVANADALLSSAQAAVSGAQSGVEAALAGIQSAEAAVLRAEADIEDLTVRAPFSGLLETDTAEFGSYLIAQGGGLCATIIQLDPIKLVGFVPEAEIDEVNVGALAGARLAGGREVAGIVTFLSRSADLTTRTFRVEVEVPNADLSINDGQTATIAIATEGETAHLIPASSLTLNDFGALGVRYVVEGQDGDEAAFAPVKLLRDTAEGVWVGGLPGIARIIVVGQDFVTQGTHLKVSIREDGA